MGPHLKVWSDRLEKLGTDPATPGLQGEQFIHYTIAAPHNLFSCLQTVCSDNQQTACWISHTRTEVTTSIERVNKTSLTLCILETVTDQALSPIYLHKVDFA